MKITGIIAKAFFASAMLFTSTSLYAQVKIGTNPDTIESASNLEVEASTSGRKVKVDKGSGQLTIKDGTEGLDEVLTSDAAGGAHWQLVGTKNITQLPKAKVSGASTPNLPTNGNTSISFATVDFTEGGMAGNAGGLGITTAGYYSVFLNIAVNNIGCDLKTSTVSVAGAIRVSGNQVQAFDDKVTIRSEEGSIFNVPVLVKLKVGDNISASIDNVFYTSETGCITKVTGGSLSAHYQP